MSGMTSWIRKRFDSQESSDGIPESPEPVENPGKSGDINPVKYTSINVECETESVRTSSKVKIKSQWQRAVRKLSVNSSGYGSACEPSPSISQSGSRTSMEKPAWLLRQAQSCQPRSRHMSINVDTGPAVSHYTRSAAAPIPEGRPVTHNSQKVAPSTSLPPYCGVPRYTHGFTPELRNLANKSRTPSGSSEESSQGSEYSEDENKVMSQEFPYGPAFRAAMGRVTTFPDGTEAVMIDSALALEVFHHDNMVKRPF